MKSRKLNFLFLLFFFAAFVNMETIAEEKEGSKGASLNKVNGSPIRAWFNINNISTLIKNDGISDIDAAQANSGFEFPKGSGKQAVYTTGLLWGCMIEGDNNPRVGGSAHRSGLQPGKILDDGTPEDTDAAHVRIYRVRRDVIPENGPRPDDYELPDLSGVEILENNSESAIIEQYFTDWNEWRAEDGAPFDDVDGDGVYNPDVDIPGVPGADQTIWYVANDVNSSLTTFLFGAQPIGIEMQLTIWGYAQTGALGNMYFRKYVLTNKSANASNPDGHIYNDMYISLWSDPDVGNSGDDYVGCDTTLSLSFAFNANAVDPTYNPLPPPAVGYDFFQGPLLDGVAGEDRNKNGVDDAEDFGIFNGETVGPGKINLPMTAFYYFARGDATVTDPPQQTIQGSQEYYNFFQGRVGKTGNFFVDPITGLETTFVMPGDPQTRTGWVDGLVLPSGDRRMGMVAGPFDMAPGDVQEVVVAEIAAGAIPGVDRLSAIGLLKFYDQQAQLAYNNNFNLPVPPPAPEVNVVQLDKRIVLDWGENQDKVRSIESSDEKGYQFQGYNVYQLPSRSADKSLGRLVATFDLNDGIGKISDDVFDVSTGSVINRPVQFGNDTGIQRYLGIENDELSGGTPLINGIRYYFAVTAYSYNPDPQAKPNNLENPLSVITVTPHSKDPGMVYEAVFADTLEANHNLTPAEGASDGNVYPVVVDQTQLTGLTYTVSFETLGDTLDVWHLDRSDGVRVLENQTNQNADVESPIVDGLQIRVQGAPLDVKAIDMIANGNGPISNTAGYDVTLPPIDVNAYSADWFRDVIQGDATILGLENGMQAGGGFFFIVAGPQEIHDHDEAIGRWARGGDSWPTLIPNNYEMRFTESGGMGVWVTEFHDNLPGGTFPVPFELWYLGSTLDDASDDVRMIPVILAENDEAGVPTPYTWNFQLDHEASGDPNDPSSDWVYWYMPEDESPGEAGYNTAVATNPTTRDHHWTEHIARMVVMNWNMHQGESSSGEGDGPEDAYPEVGTVFRIRMTIPNAAGVDEFTFTAPQPTLSTEVAKSEVDKINVFPNPYYAVNSEEINKYNRFVTFTHLPNKATIRIFNLAAVHVRTIEKDNHSQFQRWDLNNDSGLPVASGLYVAYIEMPEIGTTKILKLAIVQEQQILDRF